MCYTYIFFLSQSCINHNWRMGERNRCSASLPRDQLRFTEQSWIVHSQNRSIRTFRPQGCVHQFREDRRHKNSARHWTVLLHANRRNAHERSRLDISANFVCNYAPNMSSTTVSQISQLVLLLSWPGCSLMLTKRTMKSRTVRDNIKHILPTLA